MWIQQQSKLKVFGAAAIAVLILMCGIAAYANGTGLTSSSSTLSFPSQAAGTTSAPMSVTITNTSNNSVTIVSGSVSSGSFAYSGRAFPMVLGGNQSFTVPVTFSPKAAQSYSSTLTFWRSNGTRLSVSLSGTGTQAAITTSLTAAPSAMAFSAVAGGSGPAVQGLTIGANPAGALPYTVSADQAWMTLSAASGTTASAIQVGANINGLAAGNYTGHVIISAASVTNSPTSVTVTLAVTAAQTSTYTLQMSPAALAFSSPAGSSPACQSLTVFDTTPGKTPDLPISVSVDSPWLTLSAGGARSSHLSGWTAMQVQVCVTTTGMAAGTFNGHIIEAETAPNAAGQTVINSPYSIPVTLVISGAQASTLTVSPASVAFGNINLGNNNTKSVTLTNSGTGNVTISQVNVVGNGLSASGIAMPMVLSAGQTTVLSIVFAPTTAGAVNGTVSVVSDATNSPAVVPATGTGVQASLTASPSTLNFGNVTVGSSSAAQTITLSNNGTAVATISQAVISGSGYTMSGITLPMSLAVGASTSFTAQFTPTAAGSISGGVTVTSNTPNSPTLVGLSGSGTAVVAHSVSLTWVASTSVVAGYNVYVGGVSGGPYVLLNSVPNANMSYTDSTVVSGKTYFYVVTAVDANGMESVVSNEVSVIIP